MTDIKANGNVAYAEGENSPAAGRDAYIAGRDQYINKDDRNVVSYSVIEVNHSVIQETLSKIKAEINIELDPNISEQEHLPQDAQLPFVPFVDFDSLKNEKKYSCLDVVAVERHDL